VTPISLFMTNEEYLQKLEEQYNENKIVWWSYFKKES
jgi:hypothetical protein